MSQSKSGYFSYVPTHSSFKWFKPARNSVFYVISRIFQSNFATLPFPVDGWTSHSKICQTAARISMTWSISPNFLTLILGANFLFGPNIDARQQDWTGSGFPVSAAAAAAADTDAPNWMTLPGFNCFCYYLVCTSTPPPTACGPWCWSATPSSAKSFANATMLWHDLRVHSITTWTRRGGWRPWGVSRKSTGSKGR